MDNQELIKNLFKVMEEELKLYKYIHEVATLKTKVIVEGKTKKLEEIMKIEQAFILKIGKLESLREKIVISLAVQFGMNSEDINITKLLEKFDNQTAGKVNLLKQGILKTVGQLKNTNEVNSKLIKNSLEYIDFSINMLTDTNDGSNNYGNTGTVADKTKKTYFDIKF